tara:strand:- start:1118 stop:1864 length:747 start_codon:yes stop_codon:yes gene_type:complete
MSKPDGWVFYNDAILKETKDGLSSFQSGIKELVASGWLRKNQIVLENGQFGGIDYELETSQPLAKNTSAVTPKKDEIIKDLPSTEKPSTENRPTYKERHNKEKKNTLKSIPKRGALKDYEFIKLSWNTFASEYGLSEIRQLTNKRINGIKSRQRENGFKIQEIYDCMQDSPFLLGDNDNNWKASFDWVFCSADNWLKIVEGKFKGTKKNSKPKYETAMEHNARILKEDIQKALIEGNGVIDPEDFKPF